ncbi:MAG: YezD family protein [Nitrospiraceae bacterium]
MSTQPQTIQSQQQDQDIAHKILLAIKDIRFGSVEVVIHDSKVVQIERKEKIRVETNQSQPTR